MVWRDNICRKERVCNIFRAVFLVLVLAGAGRGAAEAAKRAVVIGLGEYQDRSWGRIHGDRDVPVVRKMLRDCGYSDIRTIVNRQASKRGIEDAFSSLVRRCERGDVVYIHFSGHGQQVTDVNGDEEDGWDEAWIPYDAMYAYSDSYKGERHLVDDEIAVWMTHIREKIGPSGSLLVVVDSCHSGDSLRSGHDVEGEEVCVRGADNEFVIPLKRKPPRTAKVKEAWLTLTACRDYQVNCELRTKSGGFYGMLSYALYKEYRNMAGKENRTLMSLLQKFVDRHKGRLPQNPTLSGDKENIPISRFFR